MKMQGLRAPCCEGCALSEESRRSKEPYGLLSSSFHILIDAQVVKLGNWHLPTGFSTKAVHYGEFRGSHWPHWPLLVTKVVSIVCLLIVTTIRAWHPFEKQHRQQRAGMPFKYPRTYVECSSMYGTQSRTTSTLFEAVNMASVQRFLLSDEKP